MKRSPEEVRLNRIYDVLVKLGGAWPDSRYMFVRSHAEDNCKEWRFQGHLGFGGKYRSRTNSVDCYPEDMTPEKLRLIEQINAELALFYDE